MNDFHLSLDDMIHHVASIGLDVYPPIEMKDERTRLNMFFEDVRERWPDMYEQLTTGESEFKISKPFRAKPGVQGPALPVDTFAVTARGPVFVFPLRLPDPVGQTDLENRFRDIFAEVRKTLWSAVPGHKIMKAGLVRDVTFLTGQIDCAPLMSKQSEWFSAKLVGGRRLIHYRDEKCNIRLEFSPGRIGKVTQHPVGKKVEEAVGFGLKVLLDINNIEVHPLQETDIEEVIDRAIGFWPDKLLEYLSEVGS